MTPVEYATGWYKLDINASTDQGKFVANDGSAFAWAYEMSDYEVLGETTAEWTNEGNIVISSEGLFYIWVKSWKKNPCGSYSDYTVTVQLPECTPADVTEIYITGTHDDWKFASEPVAVVTAENGTKTATVTINGQDTFEWKPYLYNTTTEHNDPVHCDNETGTVKAVGNYTLAEAANGPIVIEGWEGTECLPSCLFRGQGLGYRCQFFASVCRCANHDMHHEDNHLYEVSGIWYRGLGVRVL